MSFEQYLEQKLQENGLWPKEAKDVIEICKIKMDEMKNRWSDDIDNYPLSFIGLIWSIVKYNTLEYIDKNKPQHWARPMFVE